MSKFRGIIDISLKSGPHFKLFQRDWIFILRNIKQNTEFSAAKPSTKSEENFGIKICPETIYMSKHIGTMEK